MDEKVIPLLPREVVDFKLGLLERSQEKNEEEHKQFLTALLELKQIPASIADMKETINRIETKFSEYQKQVETREAMQTQLDVQRQAIAISKSGEIRQMITTILSLVIGAGGLIFSLIFFLLTHH